MGQPDIDLVRQSVRAHLLNELNGQLREDRIAYENRVFTPPALYDTLTKLPNLWLRETLFVITDQPYALELHETRGRTLFDIFSPVGSGTERPEALRKLISEAFEKKYGLTTVDGIAVHIDRVSRDQSRQADALWWSTPLSVYWRTYSVATVNRTT